MKRTIGWLFFLFFVANPIFAVNPTTITTYKKIPQINSKPKSAAKPTDKTVTKQPQPNDDAENENPYQIKINSSGPIGGY